MSLVDDSELTERVMGAVFEVANRFGVRVFGEGL
jgi:hypothetical protein